MTGAAGAARLDVLDLSGRVVWSRALPPGEREAPGAASATAPAARPSGIYFARLRDARGSVVRRIAWLGPR